MATTVNDEKIPLSLQQLLNDESLSSKTSKDDSNSIYQECLSLAAKGQATQCLQKMSKSRVLARLTLVSEKKWFDLLLSCFEAAYLSKDIDSDTQDVLNEVFNGKFIEHVMFKLASNDKQTLEVLIRYIMCCIHNYEVQVKSHPASIDNLQTISRFIKSILIKYASVDTGSLHIEELRSLVTILLFEVEIELLKAKPNRNLYWELCNEVPCISEIFQNYNVKDGSRSIEEDILNHLEGLSKERKSRSKSRAKSKSKENSDKNDSVVKNIPPSPIKAKERFPDAIPFNERNDLKQEIISRIWGPLSKTFTTHELKSFMGHSMILLSLVVIVILGRKGTRIGYLFRNITRNFDTILKYLEQLFSILSSI